MNMSGIFKLTNLINVALPILNVNLANSAAFLLSYIKISSCHNAFTRLMPPTN